MRLRRIADLCTVIIKEYSYGHIDNGTGPQQDGHRKQQ